MEMEMENKSESHCSSHRACTLDLCASFLGLLTLSELHCSTEHEWAGNGCKQESPHGSSVHTQGHHAKLVGSADLHEAQLTSSNHSCSDLEDLQTIALLGWLASKNACGNLGNDGQDHNGNDQTPVLGSKSLHWDSETNGAREESHGHPWEDWLHHGLPDLLKTLPCGGDHTCQEAAEEVCGANLVSNDRKADARSHNAKNLLVQVHGVGLMLRLGILLFTAGQGLASDHADDDAGSKEAKGSNHRLDHGQSISLTSLDHGSGTLQDGEEDHGRNIVDHGCSSDQLAKRSCQQVEVLHQG